MPTALVPEQPTAPPIQTESTTPYIHHTESDHANMVHEIKKAAPEARIPFEQQNLDELKHLVVDVLKGEPTATQIGVPEENASEQSTAAPAVELPSEPVLKKVIKRLTGLIPDLLEEVRETTRKNGTSRTTDSSKVLKLEEERAKRMGYVWRTSEEKVSQAPVPAEASVPQPLDPAPLLETVSNPPIQTSEATPPQVAQEQGVPAAEAPAETTSNGVQFPVPEQPTSLPTTSEKQQNAA